MTASQHTIAGTVLTMPVKIRKADQHMAMFSVDADAAQRMIDYSGLKVCRYLPGRAVVILMLMRYVDGDLGQYHEYGTNVMVNPPGSNASGLRALQSAGAFIHHLPVDQAFTLEAGQTIWGYPKVMADFTVREGRQFGFDVSIDGSSSRHGVPARPAGAVRVHLTQAGCTSLTRIVTVSHARPSGQMSLTGVRYRLGGVAVAARRSPLRQGTRVAGLAQARADVEFRRQRRDVVRRRAVLR